MLEDWLNFGVNLGIKDVLWGDGEIQKPITFPSLNPATEQITFGLNPPNHTYSPLVQWTPEALFFYSNVTSNQEPFVISFVWTV
jgi:hypothetical protein